MSGYSSNKPALPEVLQHHFDRETADLHTCMPAVVTGYDPTGQTVDVLPSFRRVFPNLDEPVAYPIIQQVPLVFPSMGNSWVRFPVSLGDEVMLIFAERELHAWFTQGGTVTPGIGQKFHLSDAIAVPGLRPKPSAIVAKGAVDSAEFVNGDIRIELTAAGKLKILNSGVDLLGVIDDLMAKLQQTNIWLDPAPIVPSVTLLRASLALIKG